MKKSVCITLVLLPLTTLSQPPIGMGQMDMEKMQKMQECMQGIDMSAMEALGLRSKTFQAEIKSMCSKGQRDAAQKKAISFAKDMSQLPVMQKLKKCGEYMLGMIPNMPFAQEFTENSDRHICDM